MALEMDEANDCVRGEGFEYPGDKVAPAYDRFRELMESRFITESLATPDGKPVGLPKDETVKVAAQALGEAAGMDNWESLLDTSEDWESFCLTGARQMVAGLIEERLAQALAGGLFPRP